MVGLAIARGMIGAAQVGDGPTPEQVRLVQGLLDGYFGIEADAASLDPLSASELAAAKQPERSEMRHASRGVIR